MGDAEKKPTTSCPTAMVWIVVAVIITALIAGYAGYSLGKPSQPAQPAKMALQAWSTKFPDGGLPESLAQRTYTKAPIVVSAYNYTVIQQAAQEFFAPAPDGSCVPRSLFAETLGTNASELSKYWILDVRAPDDYAAGHIAGATNIPITEVFKPENLAKLPKNQPILVVCSSGTSASMSTSVLNLMGYDAWQLRYGIGSWKDKTPTAVWSMDPANVQDIIGGNYPVVKS